jgi:hypothetical protein
MKTSYGAGIGAGMALLAPAVPMAPPTAIPAANNAPAARRRMFELIMICTFLTFEDRLFRPRSRGCRSREGVSVGG